MWAIYFQPHALVRRMIAHSRHRHVRVSTSRPSAELSAENVDRIRRLFVGFGGSCCGSEGSAQAIEFGATVRDTARSSNCSICLSACPLLQGSRRPARRATDTSKDYMSRRFGRQFERVSHYGLLARPAGGVEGSPWRLPEPFPGGRRRGFDPEETLKIVGDASGEGRGDAGSGDKDEAGGGNGFREERQA